MRLAISIIAVGLGLAGALTVAQAQTRVFVAASGSDSNVCSFAAPCRSFQHAHDTVAANGEIVALDPTGYGTLTINKAVSIDGQGFAQIIVGSGGTGIAVTANTNDAISLRGLIIDGQRSGQYGIIFNSGKSLAIDNCVISHLLSSGIAFAPNNTANLTVSNTAATDNAGDGAYVQPTGTAGATALFDHFKGSSNDQHGISAYTNLTSGSVDVTVFESIVANNGIYGINASYTTGAATILLSIYNSIAVHNGTGNNGTGIYAEGNNVTVILGHSALAYNSIDVNTGAKLVTFQDNYLDVGLVKGGAPTPWGKL